MGFGVEVIALRDNLPQLNKMLAVVDACAAAGISYPVEVIEFFGDALKEQGPDAAKLRAAMEKVRVPVTGDLMSEGGLTIRLEDLPDGATALQIRATEPVEVSEAEAIEELQEPALGPELDSGAAAGQEDELDFGETETSVSLEDAVEPSPPAAEEETLRLEPLEEPAPTAEDELTEAGQESLSLAAEPTGKPPEPARREAPLSAETIDELDLAPEEDLLDFSEEETPGQSATPAGQSDQVSPDDLLALGEDELLDLGDRDISVGLEEQSALEPPQVAPHAQAGTEAVDQPDLSVEDDLLDLDELDLEPDSDAPAQKPQPAQPPPAPAEPADDLVLAVEDDELQLDELDEMLDFDELADSDASAGPAADQDDPTQAELVRQDELARRKTAANLKKDKKPRSEP